VRAVPMGAVQGARYRQRRKTLEPTMCLAPI
jgi:hypothetical protein